MVVGGDDDDYDDDDHHDDDDEYDDDDEQDKNHDSANKGIHNVNRMQSDGIKHIETLQNSTKNNSSSRPSCTCSRNNNNFSPTMQWLSSFEHHRHIVYADDKTGTNPCNKFFRRGAAHSKAGPSATENVLNVVVCERLYFRQS